MIDQDLSFPPQLRLRKPAEYKKVFDRAQRKTDKYFTVLFVKNELQHPRLGLAIAKKIIKKAVARNTIKRAVRESFRLNQHQLGNVDIVVLARRDAANVSAKILATALQQHWLKLIDRCV